MSNPTRLHPADLLGLGRLAVEGTSGMVDVVESMHRAIAGNILPGTPSHALIARTTANVYEAVRAFTGLAGGVSEAVLLQHASTAGNKPSTSEREALLSALNGILGDHLAARQNPLAILMRLRRHGRPLQLAREHLTLAIPKPGSKLDTGQRMLPVPAQTGRFHGGGVAHGRSPRVVHCRTCGPPASSDYLHQHACAVVELSFTRHVPDEGWKTESDRTSPTPSS